MSNSSPARSIQLLRFGTSPRSGFHMDRVNTINDQPSLTINHPFTCSTSQINKARNACCNPSAARPGATAASNPNAGGANVALVSNAPPRLANYTGEVGNEPICPICGTEEYPGNPNANIVARYVGQYTCAQLYSRGYHGVTPNFMCGPLQDFARSVCGCGYFNPACARDPTKCFGRPNYVQPYTVPWLEPGYDRYARRVVPPQSSTRSQSNNGSRNLRGSDDLQATPSITDFHFETRD